MILSLFHTFSVQTCCVDAYKSVPPGSKTGMRQFWEGGCPWNWLASHNGRSSREIRIKMRGKPFPDGMEKYS